MQTEQLKGIIEDAWEARDSINPQTGGKIREAVATALAGLDAGSYRVAEKGAGGWQVHQWLKQAVLLPFLLNAMAPLGGGSGWNAPWWDKVPSKFRGWRAKRSRAAGSPALRICTVLTTRSGDQQ